MWMFLPIAGTSLARVTVDMIGYYVEFLGVYGCGNGRMSMDVSARSLGLQSRWHVFGALIPHFSLLFPFSSRM